MKRILSVLTLLFLQACSSNPALAPQPCPVAGGIPADHLIEPGETNLARLWKLTSGGENAEGYWSFAGDRLSLQRRNPKEGIDCDQIFVTSPESGHLIPVSNGRGVTTCSYFMPGDQKVLFASTHGHMSDCPPPVDFSEGYVWMVRPEYDLWIADLASGELSALTEGWGYDAEATVSPLGDRIVFTSTRSGDLELWTCDLDGSDLFQVTDAPGYDGGAFFSHDGEWLVFRTTQFGDEPDEKETYKKLLLDWKVRPHSMEIYLIRKDGTDRRQLTELGGASFAPFFFPDDSAVIFSTNHHTEGARNFDLFAIPTAGGEPRRITTYEGFDSFPMFSPDGRYLAFASNRGGSEPGETNVFIAEWRD